MTEKKSTSYFDAMVYLAGTIAVISGGIVAFFAVFASDQMMVCAYVVGALCLMGLGLGVLMSRHAPRPDNSTHAAASGG